MKDYEAVYIFDSALEEEKVNEKLDRYHELISGEGSQVTEVDHWGRRALAYEIDDHENGYYVVTHFNTEASSLPEFERILKLDDDLLRYLIVVNEGGLSTSPMPEEPEEDDDDDDDDDDEE